MIGSPSGCSRPSLRTTPLLMRALPERARVGVFLSTVHYLCFFSLFFFLRIKRVCFKPDGCISR